MAGGVYLLGDNPRDTNLDLERSVSLITADTNKAFKTLNSFTGIPQRRNCLNKPE